MVEISLPGESTVWKLLERRCSKSGDCKQKGVRDSISIVCRQPAVAYEPRHAQYTSCTLGQCRRLCSRMNAPQSSLSHTEGCLILQMDVVLTTTARKLSVYPSTNARRIASNIFIPLYVQGLFLPVHRRARQGWIQYNMLLC